MLRICPNMHLKGKFMRVKKQLPGSKERHVRIVLCIALFAMITLHGRALSVPELATPVFTDTEVATNVNMMAWSENTRQFNVTFQFDATLSNNVQVAFGTDEPADGNLSAEETGLTLGWDCGEWFIVSDAFTNRFTATPAGSQIRKELSLQMTLNGGGLPLTLELMDGSTSLAFSDLALLPVPPAWMYSKHWNLLKVTARGVDAQNEQITVKLSNDAVILLLR